MNISPLNFSSLTFTAGKKELSKKDKVLLGKIINLSRYDKNSALREVLSNEIINSLEKDIVYIAYQNSSASFPFNEIKASIQEEILNILSASGKSTEKLKKIKALIQKFNPSLSKSIVTNKINTESLRPKTQTVLDTLAYSSITAYSKLMGHGYKRAKIIADEAAYKAFRKNGSIPDEVKTFADNFKKFFEVDDDNERIYQMLDSNYNLIQYKNKLPLLKEHIDNLCKEYEKDGFTKEKVIKTAYIIPSVIMYSTDYVKGKIENNINEMQNLGFSRKDFMQMTNIYPKFIMMQKGNLTQKFNEYKNLCEENDIPYDIFREIIKQFPGLLNRDSKVIFNNINHLKDSLYTEDFKNADLIKIISVNPRLIGENSETVAKRTQSFIKVMQKYGVTKEQVIKAYIKSPTVLKLSGEALTEKIKKLDNSLGEYGFDKEKFVKASINRLRALTTTPERIEYNLKEVVNRYEKYGLSLENYLKCAFSNPSLFTATPESIDNNIKALVKRFNKDGLSFEILIKNIDKIAKILAYNPDFAAKKIQVWLDIARENFDIANNEDLWENILKKKLTLSVESTFLCKLHYKIFKDEKLGRKYGSDVPEKLMQNPEQRYNVELKNTESDREFAEFITNLSQNLFGQNRFDITFID